MQQKWIVLGIVSTGIFMSTLDGSILNIANPTIAAQFKVSMESVQWVVTAYMLVVTATLLFFGKLGDKYGGNRFYNFGFLIFAIGSFLCSICNTLPQLIGARVFQSIGASLLMATGIGLVSNAFPHEEKGRALGITGAVVGIGNLSGPAIGGMILSNFDWNMIFIINIPIGILAFILGLKFLPEQPRDTQTKAFDVPGMVLFAALTTLTLLVINQHSSLNLLLPIALIVVLLLFIIREKTYVQSFIDLSLFKIRAFTMGNLVSIAHYLPQMAVMFLLPFYLEELRHFTPSVTGLIMTVHPLTMVIVAPLAGRASDRFGSRKIMIASLFAAFIALSGLALFKADTSIILLIALLILFGISMGSFGSPNNSSILGSMPAEKQGYGGSFIGTVRNLCFAAGTAFFSSFFMNRLNDYSALTDYTAAYVHASNLTYGIAAVITLVGLLAAIVLLEKPKYAHSKQKAL